MTLTNRSSVTIPAILLAVAALAIAAGSGVGWWFMTRPEIYVAEYPDKSFTCGRKWDFYTFRTGGPDHGHRVADVYLRFKDGKVMKLSDVTEKMAREWLMELPDVLPEVHIHKLSLGGDIDMTSYDVDAGNSFAFHEGRLVYSVIKGVGGEGALTDIQIGPTPEGEFLSFPIEREDLFRVFGRPKEIRGIKLKKTGT